MVCRNAAHTIVEVSANKLYKLLFALLSLNPLNDKKNKIPGLILANRFKQTE